MARDLSPAVTLAAYGAGLALVFVAAVGVGRAVGPVGVGQDDTTHSGDTHSSSTSHSSGDAQ